MIELNIERAIRKAVETGKVVLGERETIKAARNKKAKMVIVARNCPATSRENLKRFATLNDLPVYEFQGTSVALGSVCGKPFLVSMLGVIESGSSDIMELGRKP